MAVVLLKDPLSFEFVAEAGRGMSPEDLARLRTRPGEKVDETLVPAPSVALSITHQANVKGLLVLAKPREGPLGREMLSLMELLAAQTALSLYCLSLVLTMMHLY